MNDNINQNNYKNEKTDYMQTETLDDQREFITEQSDDVTKEPKSPKNKKKLKIIICSILIFIVLCVAGVLIYDSMCDAPGCYHFKAKASSVCEGHICSYENCREAQIEAGIARPNYLYCYSHNCRYFDGSTCRNFADGGGDYCVEHTCHEDDCKSICYKNGKGDEFDYCVSHLCAYGIDTLSLDYITGNIKELKCYNHANGGGNYCIEHTCKTEGCNRDVIAGEEYCSFCALNNALEQNRK